MELNLGYMTDKKAYARNYYKKNKKKWNKYSKEWADKNKTQRQRIDRDKMLRSKYGISVEQYETMLKEQGGVCAICGGVNKDKRRLSVDHCHETGRVRGLLCRICNSNLGRWGDNEEGILKVLAYLRKTKP
jgi:hypothetical protein